MALEDNPIARPATVFVPFSDGRLDLRDAERFGRVVVLFRREIYPDSADEIGPAAATYARQALRNFDQGRDWLCMSGSAAYTAICALVLGQLGKTPRLLRHDRHENAYYEIPLEENRDAAALASDS